MRARSLLGSGLLVSLLTLAGCGGDEGGGNAGPAGGGSGGLGQAGAGTGGSGGAPGGPVQVNLDGSVQKGPFVEGSSVAVSTVDALGDPTGDVFNTQTEDDLGSFSLKLTYQGGVSIEGSGYYYNEVTGELSASDLTLRAFYDVGDEPEQAAYVNILTHLTYGRVKALLEEAGGTGGSIPDGILEQAESELRAALGVGGEGFDPGTRHSQMNMVGGDNDADAYLFAVSVVFTEIARMNTASGGSLEAELQELLNQSSSEFADTGALPSSVTGWVASVQQSLDVDTIMELLAARLSEVNSGGAVPDLHRVWDGDGDGVVDVADTCLRVANPDQQPVNDICEYRRELPGGFSGDLVELGDFTGDGHQDLLLGAGDGLRVLAGDGSGALADTPLTTTLAQGIHNAFPDELNPLARDLNADGHLDLIVNGAESSSRTGVYWGDGSGAFLAPTMVVSTPITYGEGSVDTLLDYAVLDVNGDGALDFVGAVGNPGGSADQLWALLNQGDDTWGGAVQVALPDAVVIAGLTSGDFDADGHDDVALSSSEGASSPGGLYLLWGTGSATEPYFTVDAGLTSAGTLLGAVAAGDVVGTSALDLVVGGSGVKVLEGDGARGFAAPVEPMLVPDAGVIRIGDVSGDGKNDVILAGYGGIGALIGDGTGFSAAAGINAGNEAHVRLLATGDLNGDGTVDLAAKYWSYSSLPFDSAVYVLNPP